ncbi:hypothetical protein AB0K04_08960 [Micromonospora coxensis]|uniref:hypothetical protein n=1 Tax=Micromonospora coxensis TaxID=356852 RepID=UPI00342BD02D
MTGPAGVDPAAPVLIGVGQAAHRDRAGATPAAALVRAAAHRALDDTGAPEAVRARLRTVGVAHCLSWSATDPAATLAAALGAPATRTLTTRPGGTAPLDLLHRAATAIRAGDDQVTLLAGGEGIRALRAGQADDPETPDVPGAPHVLGTDRAPSHPAEERAGLYQPLNYYPLFENAIRATGGWPALRDRDATGVVPIPEHTRWLGDLWARFAQVGAANPYGCVDGDPPDADRITGVGPTNRLVAHPYPKLLTANIAVDQAAAVLVCSAGTAAALGVPRDRWVFVAAGAGATDHWHVGERAHLHRSPAVAAAGRAVLAAVGRGVDDLAHLDLYSCFPSAVQVAAAELGVDLDRRTPTVTGGLTFAGGPASSYTFHALAELTARLRAGAPDDAALATAVGWFLTKHAVTVLTAAPPPAGFRYADAQSEVDATPRRRLVDGYRGEAVVESWTATYDRDGAPSAAYASCLLPDGARTFASSTDPDTVTAVAQADPIGARVRLDGDATFTI